MASTKTRHAATRRPAASSARHIAAKGMRSRHPAGTIGTVAALEDARRAGLLEGEKTAHISFRAPPALVEAAKRESGVASLTELGILALAMLAQPDPAAAFFKRSRGRLGKGHMLEY
jgi:hypothetical protein